MTFRLYISARIGTGTRLDPFRSKLSNFVTDDGTRGFVDWSNRATPFRFALVRCPSATHTVIAADPDIVALSPEFDSVQDAQTWLDGDIGTMPANVQTALEAAGIPIDWVTVNTSRRLLWRFISVWHFMAQRMNGQGFANALQFIASNLDSTVGSLTAAQRQQAAQWMGVHGIDSSWITGATLVREVVKYIVNDGRQNRGFTVMGLGLDL